MFWKVTPQQKLRERDPVGWLVAVEEERATQLTGEERSLLHTDKGCRRATGPPEDDQEAATGARERGVMKSHRPAGEGPRSGK
ncbi:hypothetical protein NDU88_001347 [Pleurodeles waltl]|uniref:Uncharacterized protein n=1 Tax=Pleurodeles waltl TaxID=8319 RepID=A0AAV7MJG1_PLEWA|nr:hypothetical protein NDU88_001347 [Pleurodeles waltl]